MSSQSANQPEEAQLKKRKYSISALSKAAAIFCSMSERNEIFLVKSEASVNPTAARNGEAYSMKIIEMKKTLSSAYRTNAVQSGAASPPAYLKAMKLEETGYYSYYACSLAAKAEEEKLAREIPPRNENEEEATESTGFFEAGRLRNASTEEKPSPVPIIG